MSQLKRLMPGRTVQLYKRKKLKALTGKFYEKHTGADCGCVLTANFIKKDERNATTWEERDKLSDEVIARATQYCGIRDYVDGIMNGFDHRGMADRKMYPSNEEWAAYSQGYKDGEKTFGLLAKHGLIYSG